MVWSHNSIASDWVREEAEEGRRRGILIPVLIVAWVAGSYWLSRTIYRTVLEPRQRELAALADGVTETVAELAALPPARNDVG